MLDFSKRQKQYWDLTLHDGTRLQIPVPTLAIYNALREVSRDPANVDADQLADLTGQILKTNRHRVEITPEQINAFDLEDMYELFASYVEFVNTVLSDPNSRSPIVR